MAYVIKSSDATKMVLERESVKGTAGCFVAIGTLFLVIGIGLNYFMTTWEVPFVLFRILFPLFGIGAIFAGKFLPKQTANTQPEAITFDHHQGAVLIDMKKDGQERGFIRYDEIENFDIAVESRRSSSSSSSTHTSRTYYFYHVLLRKKDGGEWYLFGFNNKPDADAMVIKLTADIPLNKSCTVSIPPKLSSKIDKQEGYDKTVIHWQNHVGMGQAIFLIVFGAVFLGILSVFFQLVSDLGVFGYIVLSFILIVFLIVMVTAARSMIKNATTRFAVSVNKSNLEYYEFSKSNGAMKNKKILPLKDLHSINYSYTPHQNYPNAGLTILTHEDDLRLKEHRDKPFEAIKDFFSGKSKSIVLSITSLNPVECLQLENWLQDLIMKKGNVEVQ